MADVRPPSLDSDERATLVAFLDYLRARIIAKLEGVDEAAARRAVVGSGTTIYWLGVHLSAVELHQFQRILDGRTDNELLPPPPPPPDEDSMVQVVVRYALACSQSRRILAGFDDLAAVGRGSDRRTGEHRTVRWVLAHMIEETARHAGHLDILREWADGSVGR